MTSCCASQQRRRPIQPRRGFMLLTVVITLAIVCLVFYQLAQLSLNYLQRITEQERVTRDRWTVVTLRKALLQQTPAVLAFRERALNLSTQNMGMQNSATQNALYIKELTDQLQLNNTQVSFEARDENARLFVPGMIHTKPQAEVRNLIDRLQGVRGLTVLPWPTSGQPFQLRAWRELFQSNAESYSQLAQATERLTLWGSGRLNIYRADDKTLEETWRALFGHFPPRELMDARTHYPPLTWSNVRERLDLRDTQAATADAWFGTQSECFSVRLSIQSRSGFMKRYFFVVDGSRDHFGFEE